MNAEKIPSVSSAAEGARKRNPQIAEAHVIPLRQCGITCTVIGAVAVAVVVDKRESIRAASH